MSVPVFLAERERLLGGDRVRLEGAEGRHAAAVRRLAPGEPVELTDGAGLAVRGEIVGVDRDALDVAVISRRELPPPSPRLTVVQALAKGDRGERAVEAMTEAGVDVVVPWEAGRCVARWSSGGQRGGGEPKGLLRWRAKAREAAKQSRRVFVPEVAEPASTGSVATMLGEAALGVVLTGDADQRLATLSAPPAGDVVAVVGPEGGCTPEELEEFRAAGARPVRLGDTVLRTSTAGVAAAAVLLARSGRW